MASFGVNTSFKGDLLIGKTNYIEWLEKAELWLELSGYMPYINGKETAPNKDLYYKDEKPYSNELAIKYIDKESEFQRNSLRALGAIKSIISIDNIKRFKNKTEAKELWDAIRSTYGESSLEVIGRYINNIIDSNYSSFASVDEYTSSIQSSYLYLKELNQELPKPIIAWLLLKGLPSSFDSFSSRKYEDLAKDLTKIDLDQLITDIISEEGRINSNIALEANKASKSEVNEHAFNKNIKTEVNK